VLPSWSEELPAVLIEAGLAGLPVVATDVGSVREIVEDERTGVLVRPRAPTELATALDELLARDDRDAMGAAGRALAQERFSMAAVAPRWMELLGRLAP
jgi:glycosyltransferase involved in cell wall biosynthesis